MYNVINGQKCKFEYGGFKTVFNKKQISVTELQKDSPWLKQESYKSLYLQITIESTGKKIIIGTKLKNNLHTFELWTQNKIDLKDQYDLINGYPFIGTLEDCEKLAIDLIYKEST